MISYYEINRKRII